MANIVVTKDGWLDGVITANRDLIVTVTLTGVAFSVYWRIMPRNIDTKAVRGQVYEFPIFDNETVAAWACGAGTIQVDTRNA